VLAVGAGPGTSRRARGGNANHVGQLLRQWRERRAM